MRLARKDFDPNYRSHPSPASVVDPTVLPDNNYDGEELVITVLRQKCSVFIANRTMLKNVLERWKTSFSARGLRVPTVIFTVCV